MIAAAIDRIAGLVRRAHGTEVTPVEGITTRVLVRKGETWGWEDLPPKARQHVLAGLDGVEDMAGDGDLCDNPTIFHDHHQGVVLQFDREDRRERACMPLQTSEQFGTLCALDGPGQSFDVRSLVRYLRHDLAGTGLGQLITAVSNLDFQRSNAAQVSVTRGGESLGRQVEAKVQQADNVPETFAVTVPVYTTSGCAGLTTKLVVGVYLEAEQERVLLRLLPDQLEASIHHVQRLLGEELRKRCPNTPVFCGTA